MSAKNRVTINLDDKSYAELTALSAEFDVSLAWLGRRACSDLLARYNGKAEDEQGMLAIVTSTKKTLGRS